MHILIATDGDYVVDDVKAALDGPGVRFTVVTNGRDVSGVVDADVPDLAVLDLQIGSMGGVAVTMGLRLDESSGRLPHVPVLLLLDRRDDVYIAQRCAAEQWLVKPLDALKLQKAAKAAMVAGAPLDEPSPETLTPEPAEAEALPAG